LDITISSPLYLVRFVPAAAAVGFSGEGSSSFGSITVA
jgi:hypothetical protein